MRSGLIAVGIGTLALAGRAESAPRQNAPLSVHENPSTEQPRVNFRLVRDPPATLGPVRNSGMIAQTEIAPNATFGFGILRASRNRFGPGQWQLEPGTSRGRKAAVSFDFRF